MLFFLSEMDRASKITYCSLPTNYSLIFKTIP